mgnify:CR=1 FL=1
MNGTNQRGENHPRAKLTNLQADEIRTSKELGIIVKDFFEAIKRITDAYRAGAGLPPLKNPPEPEILNGRDEGCCGADEDEPDRYQDEDARLDSEQHGQVDDLNKLR